MSPTLFRSKAELGLKEKLCFPEHDGRLLSGDEDEGCIKDFQTWK
jgi:hypothetical protein